MIMKEALITCLIATSLVAGSPRSDYSGTSIQPPTQTNWGRWGPEEWCPSGTYAVQFHLKVEASQGGGRYDDTALNAIDLYCRATPCQGSSGNSKWIHSEQGPWGKWRIIHRCRDEYVLVGAEARSEPLTILGDDTAVNNYKFRCRHVTQPSKNHYLSGDGESWGSWGAYEECPEGTAICGIKTQVERPQGSIDDTSLNDAVFYCCTLPQSCTV